MSEKEIKKRVLNYLKKFSGQCFGAYKINNALNLDQGGTPQGTHLAWNTHNKILKELAKEGLIKQCGPYPKRQGFCFIEKKSQL